MPDGPLRFPATIIREPQAGAYADEWNRFLAGETGSWTVIAPDGGVLTAIGETLTRLYASGQDGGTGQFSLQVTLLVQS